MEQQLAINAFVVVVSVVSTLLITRWYFKKGVQVRRLSWTANVERLVNSREGLLSRVQLSYQGTQLKGPQVERIYVWNSGTQTISMPDVSDADPLRLAYNNATVVEVYDVKCTRAAVSPQILDMTSTEIKIVFDYLDPGDGICLSVLVDTEKRTWGSAARLVGSIKGLTHSIVDEEWYNVIRPRSRRGLVGGVCTAGFFLTVTILLCVDIYFSFEWSLFLLAKIVAVIATGGLTMAAFGITFEGRLKSGRLPSDLLRRTDKARILEAVPSMQP